jgi:hypothetical protein
MLQKHLFDNYSVAVLIPFEWANVVTLRRLRSVHLDGADSDVRSVWRWRDA